MKRHVALLVLVSMLITSSMQSGARASAGSKDRPATTGDSSARASTLAFASIAPDGGFKPIKRPKAKYTDATCVIDISALADFTELDEVEGCGVTVSLGFDMVKRSVPGSWATWGSPPSTETATPHVLRTNGPTTYRLTYSSKSKVTGLEAEPSAFALWEVSVSFLNAKGEVKGTITRLLDGEGGARLFAARTRGVKTVTISSGADFAIAQLRVKV